MNEDVDDEQMDLNQPVEQTDGRNDEQNLDEWDGLVSTAQLRLTACLCCCSSSSGLVVHCIHISGCTALRHQF